MTLFFVNKRQIVILFFYENIKYSLSIFYKKNKKNGRFFEMNLLKFENLKI